MQQVKEELSKNGFAVLTNVVSTATVEEAKRELWDFIEKTKPNVSRNNKASWTKDNWLEGFCGIINYSVGHHNFMWKLRTDPGVLNAFASLWDVPQTELLVSFDGCNASIPMDSNSLTNPWPHVDQAYPGLHCVQGFICLSDSLHKEDGGLHVIQRSHMLHDKIFSGSDYKRATQFSEKELLDHYGPNFQDSVVKVKCKSGDLILWDSRTCHWAVEPLQNGATEVRMVAYVCMTPRKFATPEAIVKKKQAFVLGHMTSHLPHSVDLVEDYYPAVKKITGFKVHPLERENVTDQIAQLAGFKNLEEFLNHPVKYSERL